MKFFIINTDYIRFVTELYSTHPGLAEASYEEQYRIRMESCFGTADFYSCNLQRLGHAAWDVIANLDCMQKKWAKEHHVQYADSQWRMRLRKGMIPWLYRDQNAWLYPILAAQVKAYRPDVIYCMAIEAVGSEFLRSVQGYYKLAVGQHAATPLYIDFRGYDLILSSLPNQVDFFRQQGVKSELLRLGFEPRILDKISKRPPQFDLAFVGGIGGIHQNGTMILEALAKRFDLNIWGYGAERLDAASILRRCHKGSAWGQAMYQILSDAKIVFNRHANLADRDYANNMRLYEATGAGALLVTDARQNLSDMFDLGKEVVAYTDVDDCLEKVAYYLAHDEEREAIAQAGQRRTLHEHTWHHRMQELLNILENYL